MPDRLTVPWHVEECSDEHMENCPCIVAARVGDRVVYIADGETPELAARIVADHNAVALAREFRIPLTSELGGYGEVVVERGGGTWAVTVGAFSGKQAWLHGVWRYISDVGRAAVFTHTLDEALALGREVAAIESARTDADIRAELAAREVTA